MRFHELPLWNPYYCGGISGLGIPSERFSSPTFLLTLIFGTLRGTALTTLVMTLIGLEGTFRYARARGAGTLGALAAAPIFALSGVFAYSTHLAWTNFFSFELVPWALLGVRLALGGSRRGVVLAAVAVGWMIGFGGTYTGPFTLLAAAFETGSLFITRSRRSGARVVVTRGVSMGLVVVLLAAALSMVHLWPVAETLSSSPRILGGTPGTTPTKVWTLLFGELASHWTKGDFLIGLPVLPIVAFGVFRKRVIAPALGMAVWIWFALGYKVSASIFAILRTIPPYTMLRAPERFLVFVALAAATIAALGVRRVEVAMRKNGRFVALALAFHALLLVNAVILIRNTQDRAADRRMDAAPLVMDREFRQARGNRWIAAFYPYMSRGTLQCFDDYDIAQSTDLRSDLPQEEYLRDTGAGTVERVRWAPSHIDLKVDLTRPARVYVNQNWHPGWRSNVGAVVAENGLLAVDLPAGSHALSLRFRPRSAVAGIGTSLLGLLVVGLIAWRARKGDTIASAREWLVTAALSLAPLVVVGLSFVLIKEPRPLPPPLLTPAGEPIVVDAPPEDTTPLNVRWPDGLVLQASHLEVEPRDETHGTIATLELDWRFDKVAPPGLGIFVWYERQGSHFTTDHVLLSEALLPEAAPLGKTIRDISEPINIPETKTEVTWNVYAGFWRARRDMSRVGVIDPGTATVAKDRVLVGTFTSGPPSVLSP